MGTILEGYISGKRFLAVELSLTTPSRREAVGGRGHFSVGDDSWHYTGMKRVKTVTT